MKRRVCLDILGEKFECILAGEVSAPAARNALVKVMLELTFSLVCIVTRSSEQRTNNPIRPGGYISLLKGMMKTVSTCPCVQQLPDFFFNVRDIVFCQQDSCQL